MTATNYKGAYAAWAKNGVLYCSECLHGDAPVCPPAADFEKMCSCWEPRIGAKEPGWGCGHDCRDRECTGCKVTDPSKASSPAPIGHNGGPPLDPLPENPKAIYGRAKPSLALLPGAAWIETAGVFQLGAEKYGPFNWRKDPVESMTYANAALRHLVSWIDGNDTDAESGESELAHAIACLAIVLDAKANDKLIDDRPHKGISASLISLKTKTVVTRKEANA